MRQTDMFLQLSWTRIDGIRFTSFIMTRVVRLTVETNALTGTFSQPSPLEPPSHRVATFKLASLSLVSYSLLLSP
jgi:hypothetical protein